jgi:Tol biopolymer transport system component
MSRSWFVLPAIAAVLVVACSSGAAAVANPSASTVPSLVATASLSTTITAAPSASAMPSASGRSATAAASALPITVGEPWLLFGRRTADGSGQDVRLVRTDGTGEHQVLADVPGDLRAAAWSPDGNRIAFVVRDDSTDGTIWTANGDGTGAAKFYDGRGDGCASVFYPSWSPDGSKMALVCYPADDKHAHLAVLDTASMHLATLADLTWPEFLDDPISWSHDGKTLAFAILHWDPTNQFLDGSLVATVPADGSAMATRLTAMTEFATYPDWGADGRLVYNTYDVGNMHDSDLVSNLFTMASDGSGARRLTTAKPGSTLRIAEPRWDPSGARIWVSVREGGARPHLGWVDPATGKVTSVDAAGYGAHPEPRPHP